MPRQQRSFAVDRDLGRLLDDVAEREGVSRSEMVNILLEKGLASMREQETVDAAATAGVATASLVAIVALAVIL